MPTTKVSTVRLAQGSFQRLTTLMKATDRTRSQLVRYALATYISTKSEPTAAVSILSEHISLRLPEGIDKEVQTYASRFDVSSSDVIRCAIDTYLNVDNKNLGQGAINHV